MNIEKTTEKYNFYKEGADYVLDLGNIKRGENTKTELLITGLEDSNNLTLEATCGCTSLNKTIVDQNTQTVTVSYNQCDSSFSKIMRIKYKGIKVGVIKVKGFCQ